MRPWAGDGVGGRGILIAQVESKHVLHLHVKQTDFSQFRKELELFIHNFLDEASPPPPDISLVPVFITAGSET